MNEFRIHHDVNELLSLLRVHGGEGAEVYIDLLQKNRTPYVTTSVSAHSAKVGRGVALQGAVPGASPQVLSFLCQSWYKHCTCDVCSFWGKR